MLFIAENYGINYVLLHNKVVFVHVVILVDSIFILFLCLRKHLA